uniref:Uncharacterized protein n=1 Tax=Tanacetum cinerariifolium TaxID=118510 RepID=A0A6L2LPS1_TANCI|nr:hypothetical protein [Tanacetum cinerariifolium]
MNNKKRIINLEYFREMLHICPRIPNQTFDELPFEEEILAFLRYLGHSGEIKKITDVNINKLHQPWRSFAAVINKCLIEHKDAKKSNKMYYLRDDQMFTTIKLVSRHQNIQQFGAMLPFELTNKDIRNSTAYKEYYAIASGAAPPKTKASVRKTHNSFDTTMPPLTATGTRLSTSAKETQLAKSSKAKGLSVLFEVALIEAEQIKLATKRRLQKTHISQASGSGAYEGTDDDDVDKQSNADDDDDQEDEDDQDDDDQDSDNDSDDFVHPKLSTHDEEAKDEESFDPIVQTPSKVENSDDESNDDEIHGMNVERNERPDAEDDDEELYRDVNINLEGRDVQMIDVHTTQVLKDTHVTLTPSTHKVDVPVSTTVVPLLVTAPTLPPLSIPIMSQTLEANFSEFMQTNQFAGAVSSILSIVDRYIDHRMNEAVKVAIIEEQVKDQVKVQVSKILPKIKKTVNEQLEAEVLTRSSNSSKTSYAVAADLSELELKKILIKKMESNKSIHRSDEQRNLYKALVDAYECDKIILDTYGDTVTFKRHCDDEDTDEEPSAGSDRGSKRRREGKELESTSAPKEKASKTSGKSTEGSIQPWISDLAKQADSRTSFNELMDTPVDFLAFLMNRLKVDTLTPELLVGPTYELMKGSCVESYQKKLNLTKPNTYRSNLKRNEAYTAYYNPRGFIYQNKDKQNRLMRIDELHKFSDGTLNDVRTALDDRLKGIRMKYLSQTIWKRSDKERAAAMIQAIDKQLNHAKSGKVCWWEIVQGRLQDATTDHMMSLSYRGQTRTYLSCEFVNK